MKLTGYVGETSKTYMTIDGFDYVADRSKDKGGEDSGTSPHGFLLGSIAACKMMVAESFLRANELDFEKIEVDAESEMHGGRRNETIDIVVNMRVIDAKLTEKDKKHLNQFVDGACSMANILTAGGKNSVKTNILVE